VIPFFDMLDLINEEGPDHRVQLMRGRNFTFKQISEIKFVQDGSDALWVVQHFELAKPLKGEL
jgi:hypothetical protein